MRVGDPERIITFPGRVDGIGVGRVYPVGVQTRGGRTLTVAACMADLTVQECGWGCSHERNCWNVVGDGFVGFGPPVESVVTLSPGKYGSFKKVIRCWYSKILKVEKMTFKPS